MENIAENNRLIAEFMDKKLPYKNDKGVWEFRVEGAGLVSSPNLEALDKFLGFNFNKDWNSLFEVVKKIESLSHVRGRHYYLFMEQAYVQIRVDRMVDQPFSAWGTSSNMDKFMAIYRAVVQFIEWYNLKKK